jgi:hypothetical protein
MRQRRKTVSDPTVQMHLSYGSRSGCWPVGNVAPGAVSCCRRIAAISPANNSMVARRGYPPAHLAYAGTESGVSLLRDRAIPAAA